MSSSGKCGRPVSFLGVTEAELAKVAVLRLSAVLWDPPANSVIAMATGKGEVRGQMAGYVSKGCERFVVVVGAQRALKCLWWGVLIGPTCEPFLAGPRDPSRGQVPRSSRLIAEDSLAIDARITSSQHVYEVPSSVTVSLREPLV